MDSVREKTTGIKKEDDDLAPLAKLGFKKRGISLADFAKKTIRNKKQ